MTEVKNLKVGESLPSVQLPPVSRLDLIKYAGASGDYNPIHTIDEKAKQAGLPGIIAHGMWTMGNLSKLFTSYIEEGFVKKISTRFSGMVFLNDVVTLNAKLSDVKDNDYYFETTVTRQNGKIVLLGSVIFCFY